MRVEPKGVPVALLFGFVRPRACLAAPLAMGF